MSDKEYSTELVLIQDKLKNETPANPIPLTISKKVEGHGEQKIIIIG